LHSTHVCDPLRSLVCGGGIWLAAAGALDGWRRAQVDADAHREIGERFGVTARAPSPPLRRAWAASPAACGHCRMHAAVQNAVPDLARRRGRGRRPRARAQGFPTLKWFSRGKPVSSLDECAPRAPPCTRVTRAWPSRRCSGSRGAVRAAGPGRACRGRARRALAHGPLTRPRCARSYAGGRTAEAFMTFIQGKLAEDKGFARVPSLDRLAAAFPHEARRPGAAGRGGRPLAALGCCVPEQTRSASGSCPGVRRSALSRGAPRPCQTARPLPSGPQARRAHSRAVSSALRAVRVRITARRRLAGATCAAPHGGPCSADVTPARRAGLERASPRLPRARRDRGGARRQADKEGALEALKAAAAELTAPEEAEHAKLYVRFASKALEKVGAPRVLTLQG
jgi:hypothetical protein